MLFLVFLRVSRLPAIQIPGRDRQALGTRTPRVTGGRKGGRLCSEITMLSAEEGSEPVPQDRLRDEQRDDGAPLRLADENASGAEEISEHVYLVYQHGWT